MGIRSDNTTYKCYKIPVLQAAVHRNYNIRLKKKKEKELPVCSDVTVSNSDFWGNPSASVSKLCCCPAYAQWLPWKQAAESQCSPSPWRRATSSPRRLRLQRPKRLFKENLSCFCSARIPMDVTLRSGTVGLLSFSPLFCVSSPTSNNSQTKLNPVCADLQKAGLETCTH